MIDVIRNVSTITTIPKAQLDSVIDKEILCIVNDVVTKDSDESILDFDVGVGTIKIKVDSTSIQYKFLPSIKLEKVLKQAVSTGQSPLQQMCEKQISDRVLSAYKELL